MRVDSDARQARRPFENLWTSIKNYRFDYQGKRAGVSIAIGFTDFQRGDTAVSLYKRADDQGLRCKQGGRNKIPSHLDGQVFRVQLFPMMSITGDDG